MAKKTYINHLLKLDISEDINEDIDITFWFKSNQKVKIAEAFVNYFKENRKEATMLKRFLELAEIESNKEVLEEEMVQ